MQAFVPVRCVGSGKVMIGRFVERDGSWDLAELHLAGDRPAAAKHAVQTLRGRFGIARDYRGCPGCGNRDYVRCNRCCELTCWSGAGEFLCMACGQRAAVSGGIEEVNVEDYG